MKIIFLTLWVIAVGTGMGALWTYGSRPGEKGPAPSDWPADNFIAPQAGKYNLVLSFHPQCPCSSATVEELSAILARTSEQLHVHALVYLPSSTSAAFADTNLTAGLKQLPHTTISFDADGKWAARIGALTSGEAQLFAPDGRCVFRGGITGARGHAGENTGRHAVIALVNGESGAAAETAVYGCAIHGSSEGLAQ
jgi:hypothetical protein